MVNMHCDEKKKNQKKKKKKEIRKTNPNGYTGLMGLSGFGFRSSSKRDFVVAKLFEQVCLIEPKRRPAAQGAKSGVWTIGTQEDGS